MSDRHDIVNEKKKIIIIFFISSNDTNILLDVYNSDVYSMCFVFQPKTKTTSV